jgi:hypothetical protein
MEYCDNLNANCSHARFCHFDRREKSFFDFSIDLGRSRISRCRQTV